MGQFFFVDNLLITFRPYNHAKYMFLTFLIWLIIFQIFVILRSTETLVVLNFWLEVYT